MGIYCAAYGCNNRNKSEDRSLHFHRFPHKRPEILKKWIHAVRRVKWKPSMYSRLCSDHFTGDCYQTKPGTDTKLLKEDAVPSVFKFPAHLMKKKSERRILVRISTPTVSTPKSELLVENHVDAENEDGPSNRPLQPFSPIQEPTVLDDNIISPSTPKRGKSVSNTPRKPLQPFSPIQEPTVLDDNIISPSTPKRGKSVSNTPRKIALRRKIRNLQAKLRRRNQKITSLKELISQLKKKGIASQNLADILSEHFSGFPLEMLVHQNKNKNSAPSSRKYSEIMKGFALTLYFHSPKAYKYVRSQFHLPHPSRIRKWISSVKCYPGLLEEVLNYLKGAVDTKPHLKHCILMFDSISIRKQITWNSQLGRGVGYIDMGGVIDTEVEGMAAEALVFMIVSICGSFKCPVAYFLVSKISSEVQTEIVKTCLQKLHEVGVNIYSITCDGAFANINTLKQLGCNFDLSNVENFKVSFTHPATGKDVCVFIDPCHMLKLARNTLADKRVITSHSGAIKWEYLISLNTLQEKEMMHFANKLSGVHICFWNKKQNVKLATQTLSSSVADALQFLLKSRHPEFQGCEATIEFIRMVDRLFDILNSRNPFGKGFKQPIKLQNKNFVCNALQESLNYLLSLSVDGIPLYVHARKTFVLGFAACIKSTQIFICNILENPDIPVHYLLMYKISQDHLELFFSCIRARGGNNNNPNSEQFRWALRKLLFRNSVEVSDSANCTNLGLEQCSIFQFRSSKFFQDNCDQDFGDDFERLDTVIDSHNLSFVVENVVSYVAGFVVRKMLKHLTCDECCSLLIKSNAPHEHDHTYSCPMSFVQCVSRGGLIYVSRAVLEIVRCAEKNFKCIVVSENSIGKSGISQVIERIVVQHFSQPEMSIKLRHWGFSHSLAGEFGFEDLHETQIVRQIVRIYLDIRFHHHAKKLTLKAQGNKASIRQKLNKVVLFSHV